MLEGIQYAKSACEWRQVVPMCSSLHIETVFVGVRSGKWNRIMQLLSSLVGLPGMNDRACSRESARLYIYM